MKPVQLNLPLATRKQTRSLEDAAKEIGVAPYQALTIIKDHPDIFSGIDTQAAPPDVRVSVSSLQAFKSLYKDAWSFVDIASRLGVSIKRLQKVKSTPGTAFLGRSYCAQYTCPKSGRPKVQRNFPQKDAKTFIEYCEARSIFKFLEPSVRVKAFTYESLEAENVVRASKAYRFQDAVQDGFNPQEYRSSDIVPGKHLGKLVFKVWGRRAVIQCFFVLENDERICLTAFRPHATPWRGYTPKDGKLDFSSAGIEGTCYSLTTGMSQNGMVSFLSAQKV